MKILIVGAGVIGAAVARALSDRHEVLSASRSGELAVDLTDPASIEALLARTGPLDALVSAAGAMHVGPVQTTTPADFRRGLDSKLMGQVNLALIGQHHLNDGGSITLTSGILADEPIRHGANIRSINLAVEGFVLGAAVDLPRGQRINVVSPGVVTESWDVVQGLVPGFSTVDVDRVARAYVRSIEGGASGQVFKVW